MQNERWCRYFPDGSLSAEPDLHSRLAGQFCWFLRQMDETPLEPPETDQPLVIRLLCIPTWSPACCVRIEAGSPTWRLAVKEMSGEAGFDAGELIRTEDWLLTSREASQIAVLWDYLHFWSLPAAVESEDVLDGTTFALEAAQGGRYHVAHRDDFEWGETFGEVCRLLLRLAKYTPS